MLENLKKRVCEANILLKEYGLITLSWGNVSEIDRESGLVVIKPSGVSYDTMKPEDMVVVDLSGNVVEGELKPSSDTPTHLELYRAYPELVAVTHTHSRWATIYAQSARDIPPLGTTHADLFFGAVPCTRPLTDEEIMTEYEHNTAKVIEEYHTAETIKSIPAVLVCSHGPFIFGNSAKQSVDNALVLEEVAMMAWHTETFNSEATLSDALLRKHYLRKHGKDAYYGQKEK